MRRLRIPLLLCAAALTIPAPRLFAQLEPPGAHATAPDNEQETDEAEEGSRQLIHDVRADLIAERFDNIDRLAAGFRRDKSRWNGGAWKLRTLYGALDAPHQTEPDTVAHLDLLRRWMQQRPESITARVALATSLTRWAWVARGNGVARTVTDEGRKLFEQRIAEAQAVLEGSRDMRNQCPQWFSEEMVVGLAQGWNERQMRELFDRAVQFEPEYQYFYKQRTNYLLPKWYGSPTDASSFAKSAADHVGGDMGDYIYWETATVILHRGNGDLEPMVKQLDWARIQRGYQVLNSRFHADRTQRNQLAFMAYKFNDNAVAQQQFASIGNEWNRGVWRDRNFFEKVRDWSTGHNSWP
ncbi:protein of unknown function [Bryocella elongata]|uniref:Uncharacterized protein n=1 Tax=Bryocella elongata TaxID=863522 RepID=A0A1H5SNB7_9BACT|nr:DUF4034 domain-containing protein [Bryocella elongata]SEF51458.1 protein of unknown function [Bryocella elongata]